MAEALSPDERARLAGLELELVNARARFRAEKDRLREVELRISREMGAIVSGGSGWYQPV